MNIPLSPPRHLAFGVEVELTGKRVISDYRDIDIATVNAIAGAFDNIRVDETVRSSDFGRFLMRDKPDMVVFGQFEDIRDFIRALRRSKKVNVATSGEKELSKTADSLPVINVSRALSFDFGNTERQLVRHYGDIQNDDGDIIGVAEAIPCSISYKLSVAAWDRNTLEHIVNAITSFFFNMRSNTAYTANQIVFGNSFGVECAFVDTLGLSFDDVSVSIAEQRLYAAETLVSVNTDLLVVWDAVQNVVRYVEATGAMINER